MLVAASVNEMSAGVGSGSPPRASAMALTGTPQPAVGESCVDTCADQSSSVTRNAGLSSS